MQPKAPSESATVLAHWMGIGDTNANGDIHGGTIMKLVDEAAGLASVRHSGTRTVTASMDRMSFLTPIQVGEFVTVNASITAAWNSSMEIGVKVEAENPLTGEIRHASTAYLTMVSIDKHGRPTRVNPVKPVTSEDQRRNREAELRRSHRLAEREAIEHGRQTIDAGDASDGLTD